MQNSDDRALFDSRLSQRDIALDPAGYFLIRVDLSSQELIVEHFSNEIDSRGLAVDPDTGEVISCKLNKKRKCSAVFRARTAKEMGIKLTEGEAPFHVSRLDHALYLGRELQRAEQAMISGSEYVQD